MFVLLPPGPPLLPAEVEGCRLCTTRPLSLPWPIAVLASGTVSKGDNSAPLWEVWVGVVDPAVVMQGLEWMTPFMGVELFLWAGSLWPLSVESL